MEARKCRMSHQPPSIRHRHADSSGVYSHVHVSDDIMAGGGGRWAKSFPEPPPRGYRPPGPPRLAPPARTASPGG
eukprot:3753878-Alexandrium_andersonii.AAC.1